MLETEKIAKLENVKTETKKEENSFLKILSSSTGPVSGGTLSQELHVSRQIIVQDISLLRANGSTIFSTNKGYLLQEEKKYSRVFKVYHTDDQVEEELSTIVDAGGRFATYSSTTRSTAC